MLSLSLALTAGLLGAAGDVHAGAINDIPAWARKYNRSCSSCHYPAPPRLNATGIQFRWAGYRMPEEIGEEAEVDRVSNYLGTRGRFQYVYEKPKGAAATRSDFALPDLSVFYAGAYAKNFGGYFELAKEDEETEFSAQVVAVWGSERAHGGARAGQTHLLLNAGIAGFDRPVGINAPTPLTGPVTTAIPFSFGGDQAGIEAFYVAGSNRVSAQLFNGIQLGGEEEGGLTRKKDFVLTDQLLLDASGSGIIGTAYYGTVAGLDPSRAESSSHFWRLALSASKILSEFELQGGAVYGRDFDLPVGGASPFTSDDNRGYGYWVSGQYFFGEFPLSLFGRYEFVDPDTDTDADGSRRLLFGSVLPVTDPEYLRFALEYWLDDPQGSPAGTRNNLAAEVMLSF